MVTEMSIKVPSDLDTANVSPAQEASSWKLASSQGRHNSHPPAAATEETPTDPIDVVVSFFSLLF